MTIIISETVDFKTNSITRDGEISHNNNRIFSMHQEDIKILHRHVLNGKPRHTISGVYPALWSVSCSLLRSNYQIKNHKLHL